MIEQTLEGPIEAYTIRISERQRAALQELLEAQFGSSIQMQGMGAPLEYWTDMVKDLPKDEAASPGVIHGFCL